MNLSKLAAIAVVAIIVVLFLLPDRYEHEVLFEGREFKHSESVGHDGLTSYFYTTTGGNPGEANEFIQLVVFDEGPSEGYRSAVLKQTTNSFKLKPTGDGGSTYQGSMGGKGQEVHVYARDARAPELDSIAIYVTADEMSESEARNRADDVFRGLQGVQAQLQ